ncbi:hypothetical protein OG943_33530 [Amycolatopsis sp. NBC_00345]|uniref:DUF6779 domain-containing protein n=1 Tax=Amycolatopsis sp. NBC_00345 TaxID=2975955 RepID=UPI002E25C7DD
MTGVGDDSRGRLLGRPWLVVGFLLVIGATLALVLSDDLRFLRLGIVAALWAALIGAFLAVRYRKHAAHSEDTVAEAQAVYELELEREIAARREYELEIEAETREAVQAHSREELEALRAEVSALRESLQSLFGGEVLLERVALTAQATRMRSLSDEQRLVAAGSETKNGNGKKPAQLMAPKKPVVEVNERPTELMDRVLDSASVERRRKPSNGVGPHGPGPGGQQGPNGKPSPTVNTQRPQQLSRPKPNNRPQPEQQESAAARAVKAAELRAEASRRETSESQPTRTVAPVAKPESSPAEATRHVPRPQPRQEERHVEESRPAMRPAYRAEMSQPDMRRVEPRAEASQSGMRRVEPQSSRAELSQPSMRRVEPPVSRAEVSRPDLPRVSPAAGEATATWKPAWEGGRKPGESLSAAFPKRDDFADRQRPSAKPENPPKPREAAPSRTDLPSLDAPVHVPDPGPRKPSRLEQFSRADLSPLSSEPAPAPVSRHGAHRSSDEEPAESSVNQTLPEAVRSNVATNRGGGRRRRSEDEPTQAPEPTGGGRRRRADGEPPSWEGRGPERASQSHREVQPAETPEPKPTRGRRSAEDAPQGGSHTAGRSVTELLAANGADAPSPRRRRRAED